MRMGLGVVLAAVLAIGCNPVKEATFTVRASVEQLHVTHAPPGATLEARDRGGVVASGTVDALGSLVFRNLAPGPGYVVRLAGSQPPEQSAPLTVMSVASSAPPSTLYTGQTLVAGFQYLTMRDGTTLSAYVTLPGPPTGRYPTVVNYSGYAASRPGKPLKDFEFLCGEFPVICAPPDDGSAQLAALAGFATVSVNMRGTGCSGGAYDYFETMQLLDGYDIIETVAAQRWVLHQQVGMVGLSYPGITQLFVAAQRPPSLAAIAPMSVIGDTSTTLLPGGILNDGFALSWVRNVLSKAVPFGQGWEKGRVDAGDTVCAENQLLHGQLIDNVAQARKIVFYDPAQHDRYSPTLLAKQVQVPVFLTGQWQDEQTGPYFFTLFQTLSQLPAVRLNATNGVHLDGFAPQMVSEWLMFLDLFVARRIPVDPKLRSFAPFVFDSVFGSKLDLPPTRLTDAATYEAALATWKAEPKVRLLLESGAGQPNEPGAPRAAFEQGFAQWPLPTTPQRLYFRPDGKLGASPPTAGTSASSFRHDPTAGARGVLAPGGDIWAKQPAYDWKQPAAGDAVVFEGEALPADLPLVGPASVDLFLRASVDDADVQVTLSEVSPDGKETYLQSGWLRAGHRKPGPGATEFWPAQTMREGDFAPLPPGQWTSVRIPTAGFAHVLRAGSKVRVTVDTPGGTRAEWRFALKPFGAEVRYGVAHDAAHPSSVVLPVVPTLLAPTPRPACGALRGQPCRDAVPFTNAPL